MAVSTTNSHEDGPSFSKRLELRASTLRWYADTTLFNFPSTAFIEPLGGIIGQRRALDALTLGAEIFSPGYNIFVSGLSGTGRLTTIKNILLKINPECNVPHDYAFVHNFDSPDCPRLLTFPKGKATGFASAMAEAIGYLASQIPKLFEDEKFRTGRKQIVEDFQRREREMLAAFEAHIEPRGFALQHTKTNPEVVQPEILPVIKGQSRQFGDLERMVTEGEITQEQAHDIGEKYQEVRTELYDLAKQGMQLTQDFQREVAQYEHESVRLLVQATLDQVSSRFPFDYVKDHLEDVRDDILKNLELFRQRGDEKTEQHKGKELPQKPNAFRIYSVNVILDNQKTDGCPVVIETTPTFVNLFGTVEKVYDERGYWTTDFTRIKAGSILRADGGYLIVNATDALSEAGVWKALKRVLLHRKLEIQSIESFFQTASQPSAMKPQAINLNVKVILIGDSRLYQTLYNADEDFRKIFKINAQFDYELERTDGVLLEYARFIRKMSDEENLLHFDPDGVAAVVEYAVEKAGHSKKISLVFSDIADLLREASFWAEKSSAEVVSRYHVEKANRMMVDRNAMWKEKTLEQILEGSLMIDTAGSRIGQINGLAVYTVGQIAFGKPSRVTATVAVGGQGIINIEREAHLSGSIHSKGVLILTGFLRQRFAQKRPLSLAASVVFEQSYGGVEGDSASSTEIYALLSALSRLPIRQDLAVTGSINQWGEIQPIGGVKEKIEGFFEICSVRGLTGTQGVVIPIQNVQDLMLKSDVVEAVADGKFHIYAVSTVDEGIELFTGVPAGRPDIDGNYPQGTVNYLVDRRLTDLSEKLRESIPFFATSTISPEDLAEPEDAGGDIGESEV